MPENLDIDALIAAYPPSFPPSTPFIQDRALLLIDAVYRAARRARVDDDTQFIPIPSDFWRAMRSDYSVYISWLERSGVLEIDHRYQANNGEGRCKGYRFAPLYRTRCRSSRIGADTALHLTHMHSESSPDSSTESRVCGVLPTCINASSPSLLAPYYVRETQDESKRTHFERVLEMLDAIFRRVTVADALTAGSSTAYRSLIARNADQSYLADIRHRSWRATLSATTGRLYTPVTQMSQEARKRLRIDGRGDLSVVDVRTCHSYLLIYVARQVQTLDPATVSDAAIQAWTNVVLHDDLYNFGVRMTKELLGVTQTRDMWKDDVQRVLNCRPSQRTHRDGRRFTARDILEIRFPEMMAVVDYVKRQPTAAHSRLSNLLQHLEADTMLWSVCPVLLDAGIPALTVHDAVIVPTDHASTAAEAIRKAFMRRVGIGPNIKIGPLCPRPNLD